MKQPLRATKTTLEDVLNAHSADSAHTAFVTPVRATVLAFNSGTLVEDRAGNYFISVPGEWHRWGDNTLPQVTAFDQLNSVGLTLLKKDIIKDIFKAKEVSSGQEIREPDSGVNEKIDSPVATSQKREKKSKDRT